MAEYNEPIEYKPKPKKTKTAKQALSALMNLCSRGERSSGDALRLMRTWGVEQAEMQQVLDTLIAQKYIDDRRYAEAFVRDKMNFSGWGLFKISGGLNQKGISKEIASEVLGAIDTSELGDRLEQLLRKKMKSSRESDKYKLKTKLIRSGAAAGYDLGSVIDVVNRIIETEQDYEI